MNFHRFIQSIRDALRGIRYVYAHEQNFRIQTAIAVAVIASMWMLHVHFFESIVLILLILLVLILELVNSAVEKSFDILKPRLSHQVQVAKDIMAGMVLLASLGAFVIGCVLFYPYVIAALLKL